MVFPNKSDCFIWLATFCVTNCKNPTNWTLTLDGLSLGCPLSVKTTWLLPHLNVIAITSFPNSVSLVITCLKKDTKPVPVVVITN
jgi:hypothetical protein